jgi:nucleotide-binding universal stress UspA family protein
MPVACDLGLVLTAIEEQAQAIVARAQAILNDYGGAYEARMIRLPTAGVTAGEAIAAYVAQSEADLVLLGRRKTVWWKYFDEDIAAVILRQCDVVVQIAPVATGNPGRVEASALKYVAASRRHAVIKPSALA